MTTNSATQSRVSSHSLDEAEAAWREMYQQMPNSSAFDSPEWNKTWWKHFGHDSKMMIRTVSDSDGSIAIVAPMKLDREHDEGVGTFIGSSDLVDYFGFKHHAKLKDEDVAILLDSLYQDPDINALVLESLPEDSHTIHALRRVAPSIGWELHEWEEGVAPRVSLPESEDAYFNSLTKKHRHELRRKLRRLYQAGKIEQIELTDTQDIRDNMDNFMQLHRISSMEKQHFMTTERESFFRDIAETMAELNVTRLYFLAIDGVYVATSLAFVVGKTKYLYNSGYDPARSWHAVGLLNHALNILSSIRQGFKVYDFMRGDERYKYHLGAKDRAIYTVRLDKPNNV